MTSASSNLRVRIGQAILCIAALALCSQRIVLAPGFELYLAPFFYLLALRLGGVRAGLVVAAATTCFTWFWWGHLFTIALSLAHVGFCASIRLPFRSLALKTLLFQSTVGSLAAYLFLRWNYGASDTVIALACIRKLLTDVALAAIVDMILLIFSVRFQTLAIKPRSTFSLFALVRASTLLVVVGSGLALYSAQVRSFPAIFTSYMREMAMSAEILVLQNRGDGGPEGIRLISSLGLPAQEVAFGRSIDLEADQIFEHLGCTRVDTGAAVAGPNDQNTFAYWIDACHLGVTSSTPRTQFVYATRPIAEAAYTRVLLQMLGPLAVLLFAGLLQILVGIAMRRSASALDRLLGSLGRPGLTPPEGISIDELARPAAFFVEANNHYAASAEERRLLGEAVRELKRGIELRLVTDISFSARDGLLSFTNVDLDHAPCAQEFEVHPNDRLAVATALGDHQVMVEFRLASPTHSDWYLLLARDPYSPHCWRSGCILRLRQSRLSKDRMLQHARLTELGGMASALSHELKQPLFTISLAAENGSLLTEGIVDPPVLKARAKFQRILEQVERARSIIGRVSNYARVEEEHDEVFDIVEGIRNAATFVRPLLVQENSRMEVIGADAPVLVRLPLVGLEQIVVNAVQNSIDAIASRRAREPELAGEIIVVIRHEEIGLAVEITDNGIGLDIPQPENAFEAFVTTKPKGKGTGLGLYISRQIMLEVGGAISISPKLGQEPGTTLTLRWPASVVLSCRAEAVPKDVGEAAA